MGAAQSRAALTHRGPKRSATRQMAVIPFTPSPFEIRCTVPVPMPSDFATFIFKIQKGGRGWGQLSPARACNAATAAAGGRGLCPTAGPSLLLRPHHQCPPVTYVTGDLADGALPFHAENAERRSAARGGKECGSISRQNSSGPQYC